ncbi:hypothetical protein [Mangrovimonas xylaniphaga]|uniref:hypothetical protein n=1 Tax=Mangrovimonas xylaniphaga TaxID=1645915 RepID=UPI0006B42CB5|nr:hypothetical protein [Mangrovimonas xylaniphaga]
MRFKLSILLGLTFLISCKNQTQENNKIVNEKETVSEKSSVEIKENKSEPELSDCDRYWMNRFPNDSIKVKYIDDIISKNQLTENNLEFLNALKNQKQEKLAFENVLAPIFRLSITEIGILTFPKYKQIGNKLIPISKEMDLIDKFDTIKENTMDYFGKIKFYPMLLDSLFKNKSKPSINYYTTNKIGSTKIMELGAYIDECLEYYEYSIDTISISKNDKVLFSSKYKIDLVFENNEKIDSLLKSDYKKECLDCPNSTELQKTFARIKGTDNLYFIYADTFPINNELDTPSRALIFINPENEIIYLWYDEIDLFGCSCL